MSQAIIPLIAINCKAGEGVAQSLSVSLAMDLFLLVEGFVRNGAGVLDIRGIKSHQLVMN